MIATNQYLERWKSTAQSLDLSVSNSSIVTIHLFTDQIDVAQEWSESNLKYLKVTFNKIPNYGWPEATLLRYSIFIENRNVFKEELILYLDSDMLVLGDFVGPLQESLGPHILFFVKHPGYVRRRGIKGIMDLISNPRLAKPLINKFIARSPGQGAWETNKNSSAYVPRQSRLNYVHGAIWGGYQANFLNLCRILSEQVQFDLQNDYIAVWHDESHLNHFASNNPHALLDNRFSGFEPYKHLKEWPAFITTQIKSKGEGRIPTIEFGAE